MACVLGGIQYPGKKEVVEQVQEAKRGVTVYNL